MTDPARERTGAGRKWLSKLLSRDRRRAVRRDAAALAAYYFDGAAPSMHAVRNISTSGLYLVTSERWYPGTLVMVTLQRQEGGKTGSGYAVVVQSRTIRWGEDGVGLEFIFPPDGRKPQTASSGYAIGRKDLERFLNEAAT